MKGNKRFLFIEICVFRVLPAIILLSTSCGAACCQNMICIIDFYTDPQMLALIKAAEDNDIDKLKYLINEGVDPNTVGKEGMTPLFWALGHQNKKAMVALLTAGANPNLKNSDGDSPMAMASGAKDIELMKILLDRGGDPNIKNSLGKPALHVAIGQMRIENIKMLLDYGADINAKDRSGIPPVMYASHFNQYKIIAMLLERGADHTIKTKGGVPLAWIVQKRKVNPASEGYIWREKVIKMLEDRGVKFPVSHPSEIQKPV